MTADFTSKVVEARGIPAYGAGDRALSGAIMPEKPIRQ
jgi:hypothetical protein